MKKGTKVAIWVLAAGVLVVLLVQFAVPIALIVVGKFYEPNDQQVAQARKDAVASLRAQIRGAEDRLVGVLEGRHNTEAAMKQSVQTALGHGVPIENSFHHNPPTDRVQVDARYEGTGTIPGKGFITPAGVTLYACVRFAGHSGPSASVVVTDAASCRVKSDVRVAELGLHE